MRELMDEENIYATPESDLGATTYISQTYHTYANFGWRLLAAFIDGIVTTFIGLVLGIFLGLIVAATGSDETLIDLLANVLGIIIGWLYAALMESSGTQATLGKMAVGIKVTDEQGQRLGFGRATGRHFGKILSTLMLLIGYFWMIWDDRSQCIHDKLSGCLVWKI